MQNLLSAGAGRVRLDQAVRADVCCFAGPQMSSSSGLGRAGSKTCCDNCRLWTLTCGICAISLRSPEELNFTVYRAAADLLACAWPTSPAAAGRSLRLRGVREAVDAGVDEGLHGVAAVVSPPGDRELGRTEVGDRDADDAGAGVNHCVPLGEQGHRRAGGD